jgi:16S rRNA (cytidine1402-2'-O)-methyltransferase
MLEDILQALHPETYLCIATDITLPTEYIKTKRASAWKENIDLHNRPPFFIIHKCSFVALLIILYTLSKN